MSSTSISELIDRLKQSNAATQTLIDQIDLELVVYENPEWQVRDVVWHIAVWDRQVAKSIQAFVDGSQYAIPGFDEDKFNGSAFQEGRQLTPDQIRSQSQQARREFEQAVAKVPTNQISAEFLYPWGDESGDVVQVVEEMIEHDQEHRQEIESAANR